MARIVNMDQIVPPKIEFHMGDGTVYKIDGGITLENYLRLGRLEGDLGRYQAQLDALSSAGASDEEYDAASQQMLSTLTDLNAEVLAVLRVHHPELEECPFSPVQVGIFLASLRGELDEIAGPDPTPPSPTPARTSPRRRAPSRTSTRSSG